MDNWEEIKEDANWAEVLDEFTAMMNTDEAAYLVYALKTAVKNEVLKTLEESGK